MQHLHLIIGNALIHEMHSAVINSLQHTSHQQGNNGSSGIIKCSFNVFKLFFVPLPYFSMSVHLCDPTGAHMHVSVRVCVIWVCRELDTNYSYLCFVLSHYFPI